MNRSKSPTLSCNNDTPVSEKKRKLKSKPKEADGDDTNLEDSEEFSEHEQETVNRKSKRIQTQKAQNSPLSLSPTKQLKTVKIIDPKSASLDRKQLNGAQFVAAAAAGNFNVSASIGSTSITIDSNSNVDLDHLSQNVEMLNSTLKQHSLFLKQLNNSIEKLSNKLDSKIATNFSRKTKQCRAVSEEQSEENEITDQVEESESSSEDEEDLNESINVSARLLAAKNDVEKVNQEEIENIKETDNITKESGDEESSGETNEVENFAVNKEDAIVECNKSIKKVNNIKNEFIQTVKLTNTVLEIEKGLDKNSPNQSKSVFYSSDSSKSDEDDDNDEENGSSSCRNDQRGSSKHTSSSHKGSNGTKAILNKTKIDTEFISKLIENKDPNDKRYDPNEINKLRLLSHSYQNFAVKLLMRLFDEEEIIGRNVYGRNYSGDKTFIKQPLDSERINFIKETVLRLTRTNNPELAWASCVIAMNRKMVDINNKFIKQNSAKK